MRFVLLVLSIALFVAVPGLAISPYLVRDISRVHQPLDSSPESFLSLGPLALFCADSVGDLWASDGTAAGTRVIQPGLIGRPFALAGDTGYFQSTLNGNPFALWSSQGTAATTQFLGEFSVLRLPGTQVVSVPGSRTIYFTARESVHGGELWTSDGTLAGTHLVIDLRLGDRGSEVAELTWFKGRLYFTGDDGRGFGLWSTDGTAGGTRRIRAFTASSIFGAFFLRALPNRLVYFGPERNRGYELWASDGTAAGTVPLPEIAAGNRGAQMRDAIVVGNRYYTIASDGRTGYELWTTDGTPGGTRSLTRLAPADSLDTGFFPYQLPNRLVFFANDGSKGREPWVSDGTPSGTKILADLCPGSCSSNAGSLPSPANRLLLSADTPGAGVELWTIDGTPAGTRLLKDICPGTCSPNYYGFHQLGGRILFAASEPTHGEELWSTDGTPAGTARVSNLPDPMPFGSFFPGAVAGGNLLFPGHDPVHGRELWATRGRLGTTRRVADLEPGENEFSGSFPNALTSAGSRAYFFANDGIEGYELWSSDGTEAGTRIASHFVRGAGPDFPPGNIRAVGEDGRLFFAARFETTGEGLWIADGNPDGIIPLDLPAEQRVLELKIVAGRLYFAASDSTLGSTTLWQTDWTGAPRAEVATSVALSWLHEFGNGLLFARVGTPEESGLWIDDGTSGGARRLAEVTPESEPTPYAGKLWFYGRTPEGEQGVWATDGTETGTTQTLDVKPAPGGFPAPFLAGGTSTLYLFGARASGVGLYACEGTLATLRFRGPVGPLLGIPGLKVPLVLGDRLFFESASPDDPFERELWSSDGTVAGTAPLRDSTGEKVFSPEHLQVFAGKMVGFHFGSWFVSDGTPAGTSNFDQPVPNLGPFMPPAQTAGRLFFPARTVEAGVELWALEP
ncbi:MAG: hypothetical protein ABJC13_13390 [Acidobacteriota bacterium]